MPTENQMTIFAVEPFYGGSHKAWLDQLTAQSKHKIRHFTHPERFWKWRMNGAALTLAQEINSQNEKPDLFLCSDMLDLASFRGLLKPELGSLPCLLYFHENQITYPLKGFRKTDQRDLQYGFKNITSAMAADRVFFNSHFHRRDFLNSINSFLKNFPDCLPKQVDLSIEKKSEVLPLGLETYRGVIKKNSLPLLLWNHRWEHDKNPEDFFNLCFQLKDHGVSFQLAILGEKAKKFPAIFETAKQRLQHQIIQFGPVTTRDEYWNWLAKAHYLPITSQQDFFGISLLEAMSAGVVPLVPSRLVFPEHANHVSPDIIYSSPQESLQKLRDFLSAPFPQGLSSDCQQYGLRYDWSQMREKYDSQFERIKKFKKNNELSKS